MALQIQITMNTHQVVVTGKDAEVFLEHLLVTDLRRLQLGEGMCLFSSVMSCACTYMY